MLDFKKVGFTPLLCLDDGHGMETAGKRTPAFKDGHIVHENEFNRAVINFLDLDARRLGFKTLLVAPGGTDISLDARVAAANKAYAAYKAQLGAAAVNKNIALYISQHYNAMTDTWEGSIASGVITFCYKFGGEGEKLAKAVHKYLIQGTVQKNGGVKEGNFQVIRETVIPAILVEAGFMDDPTEAALMTSVAFQKETAKQILQGICEYYGLVYVAEVVVPVAPIKPKTSILAKATATVGQAQEWARKNGATTQFIKNIGLYFNLSPMCGGVNPVGAVCQSAKESNSGKYGGIVKVEQCNPCGLKTAKATGETPADHMTFNNWDIGIAAHLDHLALYAGAAGYPKKGSPDPRHFPTVLGTAKNWEDLGGKYAPSLTYGDDIVAMMKAIAATPEPKVKTAQEVTVDNCLADGVATDGAIWLDILNGKTPAIPSTLKAILDNYHILILKYKGGK